MRTERQSSCVEFPTEVGDAWLEPATFDSQVEIGKANVEQLLVGEVDPPVSGAVDRRVWKRDGGHSEQPWGRAIPTA